MAGRDRQRCSAGLRWLLALLLGSGACAVQAAGFPLALSLQVAQLDRAGVQAQGLVLRSQPDGDRWRLQLDIARLSLPGIAQPLRELQLVCRSRTAWPTLDCAHASLRLASSPWGSQTLKLALSWDGTGHAKLVFSGLQLAAGRVHGSLDWHAGRWSAQLDGAALKLARLPRLASWRKRIGLTSLQGLARVQVAAEGTAAGPTRVTLSGQLRSVSYADASGRQAGERLQARFNLAARLQRGAWAGLLRLDVPTGELYSEPLFVDFKTAPLALRSRFDWQPGSGRLRLNQLTLKAGQMFSVNGSLALNSVSRSLDGGHLSLASPSLSRSFQTLVQPWLIGTPLAQLQLSGAAQAQLQLAKGGLVALDAQLSKVTATDPGLGLQLSGLQAALHWRASGSAPVSRVSLQGVRLGKLEAGAAQAEFVMSGMHLRLLQRVSIPFYQGEVSIDSLSLTRQQTQLQALFSLRLTGLSLQSLSQALGWPVMQGTVQAELPDVRLLGDSLRAPGKVRVQAFGGSLVLSNLSLTQLGSPAPVLEANMQLRHLNLAQLTRTFSLGRIEGGLDGDVHNLQLIAWQPNRFQARLYSPPHDRLPHRISQRAVNDLTELGNGVSGALSGTLLRFFENFSYDRIDLKVSQQGNLARIGGLPDGKGGYYIVKGAGIPRIDVIGRNHQVAWKQLLQRLQSIRFQDMQVK